MKGRISMNIGEIHQIGYVVNDIDKALDYWVNVMGVGPWFLTREIKPMNAQYRGKPCELNFSAAVANWGDMQIELIQDNSVCPSLYQEVVQANHTGIHHIAVWTKSAEEFDEVGENLKKAGFEFAMGGAIRDVAGRFAYYDNPEHPGTIVEVSAVIGAKGERFKYIAECSKDWDGKDPIR